MMMGKSSTSVDTSIRDSKVAVLEDNWIEDTQTTSGSFGTWYDGMPFANVEEENEWTRYLKLPLVHNWSGFSIRNWWLDQEFLTLSRMAFNLLAVPSMSTEVE